MNIGNLYKVKKWFWLIFPTKETAAASADARPHGDAAYAAYWSNRFNCEVTYFSLDSIVVFLEEDGVFKKVLTSDGLVGWTWFNEDYIDCFEEVEREEP